MDILARGKYVITDASAAVNNDVMADQTAFPNFNIMREMTEVTVLCTFAHSHRFIYN